MLLSPKPCSHINNLYFSAPFVHFGTCTESILISPLKIICVSHVMSFWLFAFCAKNNVKSKIGKNLTYFNILFTLLYFIFFKITEDCQIMFVFFLFFYKKSHPRLDGFGKSFNNFTQKFILLLALALNTYQLALVER